MTLEKEHRKVLEGLDERGACSLQEKQVEAAAERGVRGGKAGEKLTTSHGLMPSLEPCRELVLSHTGTRLVHGPRDSFGGQT